MSERLLKDTPNSGGIRANALKKADVQAFSEIYGYSDDDAVSLLLDLGIRGRQIEEFLGSAFGDWHHLRSRKEAAKKFFVEIFGDKL